MQSMQWTDPFETVPFVPEPPEFQHFETELENLPIQIVVRFQTT